MSKVRILPEILSNKIAAGEVVERPASVVKELVENALDAGSTSIEIDIEKGGRSLIRISDNGIGMGGDDAMLAVERYATSKIYNDEDLFSINTLGFRGEALPSISSVSRFRLVTREKKSDVATEIVIEGGRIKNVKETSGPPGTRISVEQLFYNTPARRKFLKTVATEMGHIADTVSSIALGWPGVRFLLSHNGKNVKSWPATQAPSHRVVDVLGNDLRNNIHEIRFEENDLVLSGWISSPAVNRSTSQRIFMYVNGRCIRDRGLQHALFEGYRSRLMKGRFPVAVIFIKIPFDQVDVNVHPAKHEIRFADVGKVYNALRDTVHETLKRADEPAWGRAAEEPSVNEKSGGFPEGMGLRNRVSTPTYREQQLFSSLASSPSAEEKGPALSSEREALEADGADPFAGQKEGADEEQSAVAAASGTHAHEKGLCAENDRYPLSENRSGKKFFSRLRVIGQLHNSYILCDSGEGLVLVDQHAAHERIVFEELRKKGFGSSSQALLVPETVDLGFREAAALEKMLPDLFKLGLQIEPFGGNTFVIKSVPPLLSEGKMVPLVLDIAEKMVAVGYAGALEERLEECLVLMACHGAIRANQSLGVKEMEHLMVQLDRCENPSFCPHGRPTWIKWSMGLIAKTFHR